MAQETTLVPLSCCAPLQVMSALKKEHRSSCGGSRQGGGISRLLEQVGRATQAARRPERAHGGCGYRCSSAAPAPQLLQLLSGPDGILLLLMGRWLVCGRRGWPACGALARRGCAGIAQAAQRQDRARTSVVPSGTPPT